MATKVTLLWAHGYSKAKLSVKFLGALGLSKDSCSIRGFRVQSGFMPGS